MIAFKVIDGVLQFDKNNDLILLNEKEKIKQDIVELVKHIQGTYDLRKEIGIPWNDYIGVLKSNDRDDLIMTYMYEKISNYKKIDLSSILIEKSETVNRESYFKIYLDEYEEINILDRSVRMNG